MSYVYEINNYIMYKTENFEISMQELAAFARVLSHPARLSILKFLASSKQCISGDISGKIPLSRSTVSQHLKELKLAGLIQGSVEGTRINYCLRKDTIDSMIDQFSDLFNEIKPKTGHSC